MTKVFNHRYSQCTGTYEKLRILNKNHLEVQNSLKDKNKKIGGSMKQKQYLVIEADTMSREGLNHSNSIYKFTIINPFLRRN